MNVAAQMFVPGLDAIQMSELHSPGPLLAKRHFTQKPVRNEFVAVASLMERMTLERLAEGDAKGKVAEQRLWQRLLADL